MRTPARIWSTARALGLALVLGILMSACTPHTLAKPTTTAEMKNPHETLNGASVSPGQGLKAAATEAYDLHRSILEQVDPEFFDGDVSARINERASSETPGYKDGNSYWNLSTLSYLKGSTDTEAPFSKIRAYLESEGYAMTRDERSATGGSADFRKDHPVAYINLGVNKSGKFGQIGMTIVTDHFPNPPMSEWPKPGEEETWKPSVALWPAGLGPKETASPTP